MLETPHQHPAAMQSKPPGACTGERLLSPSHRPHQKAVEGGDALLTHVPAPLGAISPPVWGGMD